MVDPRVYLAVERTFLAWIRTAVAFLAFGLAIEKLDIFLKTIFPEASLPSPKIISPGLHHLGKFLLGLGLFTLLFGKVNFLRTLKKVEENRYETSRKLYIAYFILLVLTSLIILILFAFI